MALEFKDKGNEIKRDITGILETNFSRDVKSHGDGKLLTF